MVPVRLPVALGPALSELLAAHRRAGGGPPVGLGLATVDLDRTAASLVEADGDLRFSPMEDDGAVGAHVLAATLPDGTTLRLLEPATEGPLAAFLARFGEGPAVLYVAGPPAGTGALAADGSRIVRRAGRAGPFLVEVLASRATYPGRMTPTVGSAALKPNPALEPLAVLVGEWSTVGSHPYLPGKTLHGRAVGEWIEGGAFLLWRSEIDEPQMPSGVAIFGSDAGSGTFFMLYFDERDISRTYDVEIEPGGLRWQRMSNDLSQRMVLSVAADGQTITSKGEMRQNGGAWEPDLELTYARIG
ncbi:MAG: hypothetical protein ACRDGL_08010 [Candidatus Limnocylindrales bacterium]